MGRHYGALTGQGQEQLCTDWTRVGEIMDCLDIGRWVGVLIGYGQDRWSTDWTRASDMVH